MALFLTVRMLLLPTKPLPEPIAAIVNTCPRLEELVKLARILSHLNVLEMSPTLGMLRL